MNAGAHLLVHSVDDAPLDDAFLAALKETGTYYCPTLTVTRGYLLAYQAQVTPELRAQLEHVDPSVRERILATESLPPRVSAEQAEGIAARFRAEGELMAANLRAVHAAGIPIVMGTDAGNPLTLHGPSVFPELEAMEAAGLSAADVLIAATSAAAAALGRDDIGRIVPGAFADAVVLDADPSQSAEAWRSLTHVLRYGRLR